MKAGKNLSSRPLTEGLVRSIVKDLLKNKVTSGDIPVKLLNKSDFILPYLLNRINGAFINREFLDPLKLSNLVPVHEKKDPTYSDS